MIKKIEAKLKLVLIDRTFTCCICKRRRVITHVKEYEESKLLLVNEFGWAKDKKGWFCRDCKHLIKKEVRKNDLDIN
jgi:hypothetical protein